MAFPPGVTTATISLGTMFDFRGNAVDKVTAKVEVFLGGNATKLNYRGTGQTVVPSVFTVEAAEGMISFQLPHVDQPGFFAGDGTEAKYWAYIISIQATPPGSKAVKWVKRLQPLVGQDSIDLDNVVDGELTSFVSTPKATVTSVNGMTGDVWVSGGGSGGSVDLSSYATKSELEAAKTELNDTIRDSGLSINATEVYSRIDEVEASIPDTSALVSRGELQNYALSEEIPDTSQLIDEAELATALEAKADAVHTHTDLEQSIASLSEEIPDTSQFIDVAELDAALENKADMAHTHTDLEQRITVLEESPSGGTFTLVESPAGSGLYEIQGS